MSDLSWFVIFSGVLALGVGTGELLARWIAPESSRRFVHAYTGLAVATTPWFFEQPTTLYLLAGAFIVVNLWAIRKRVFRGMHGIERRSYGTAVFPLALIVALAAAWSIDRDRVFALQIAFVVLALADPIASSVGSRLESHRFTVGAAAKSVAGSVAFALSCFVLTFSGLLFLDPLAYSPVQYGAVAVIVACLATAAELLGAAGWDNLNIVVAVLAPLIALQQDPALLPVLAGALVWALAFSLLAFALRTLELSGALAAGLLAFSVVGLGGWDWALPGFAFFVLSSALSKLGRKSKAQVVQAEKGSRRDAGQVYANGGVAWGLLLIYVASPTEWLYWGFIGAFAAAAADTWASEIGTWVRAPTRSLSTWRRVPPGVSGGVSLPGTLGALAGAATVFAPIPFVGAERLSAFGVETALLVVVGGVVASLVDSLLGDTAQALYETGDARLTECASNGRQRNRLVRGLRWVDNDRVNLACTASGAALAALGAFLLGSS